MVGDSIADFITRIKNAQARGKETVSAPYSKIKHDISEVLIKEGYVKSAVKKGKKIKKTLELELVYIDSHPRVEGVKRVSRPSRRVYMSAKELGKMGRRRGLLIVSTPKGIITSAEAFKANVGGEVLCTLW